MPRAEIYVNTDVEADGPIPGPHSVLSFASAAYTAYRMRFAGRSPFSHSALDIKTAAMVLLGTGYREATKRNMLRRWFDDLPRAHRAPDDAIEQGALFCNMPAELGTRRQ